VSAATGGHLRRWVGLVLRLLVSAALLALLIRSLDLGKLRTLLSTTDLRLVAVALIALVLSPPVSAPRWQAILAQLGQAIRQAPLIRALYIGAFFSQVLPSSVGGDVWRVWTCTRAGIPLGTATYSVLIERLAGLSATLLCFGLTFPWLIARVGDDPARWILCALLAGCCGAVAMVIVLPLTTPYLSRVRRLRPLTGFAAALHSVGQSGRVIMVMIATALIGQGLAITAFYALALGTAAPLTLFDCIVTLPPALLIALIPASLGGWGLREGAFVVILKFYGIGSEQALLLSVLFGLALLISTLPGLVLWTVQSSGPGVATGKPITE
jgi:uncharacterized membrane protein YbhN (UPF0104 family)